MSDLCHNCGNCHLPNPCEILLQQCQICRNVGHMYNFCPLSVHKLDYTYQYWALCHNCDSWHLPQPCQLPLHKCTRCNASGHIELFCPLNAVPRTPANVTSTGNKRKRSAKSEGLSVVQLSGDEALRQFRVDIVEQVLDLLKTSSDPDEVRRIMASTSLPIPTVLHGAAGPTLVLTKITNPLSGGKPQPSPRTNDLEPPTPASGSLANGNHAGDNGRKQIEGEPSAAGPSLPSLLPAPSLQSLMQQDVTAAGLLGDLARAGVRQDARHSSDPLLEQTMQQYQQVYQLPGLVGGRPYYAPPQNIQQLRTHLSLTQQDQMRFPPVQYQSYHPTAQLKGAEMQAAGAEKLVVAGEDKAPADDRNIHVGTGEKQDLLQASKASQAGEASITVQQGPVNELQQTAIPENTSSAEPLAGDSKPKATPKKGGRQPRKPKT